jgi:lipid II:glycine glycyltransferase (peptidoglycan interpeptide bridge formation enzyme)
MDEERVVGSLIAVIVQEGKGVKGYFSRRCIVWGGPLVKDDDPVIWSMLLETLGEMTNKKAIYTEFRNFRDLLSSRSMFEALGYQFNGHLNYLINIDTVDNMMSKFKAEKRRQVKKALREGVRIVQANNIEQIRQWYEILKNIYKLKIKKPLPGFKFFRVFFDSKIGSFQLIEFNKQIIGGSMLPVFGNTIYDWFRCGLDNEYKKQFPSTIAVWAGLKYAADNGFDLYDFMGAGKPEENYGVRIFKSQFGGELVNFGRFVRINQKRHYLLGKLGMEILKKVK